MCITYYLLSIPGRVPTQCTPIFKMLSSNVIFECPSLIITSWSFNNGGLLSNTEMLHNRILISGVQLKNRGKYTCEGFDNDGQFFTKEFLLNVLCMSLSV